MELILDYYYDLSKPVYLLHPSNKFWEVTLTGLTVHFRVGKIKDAIQTDTGNVEKDYPTSAAAKATVIKKINEKLGKQYVGRDCKKKQINKRQGEQQVLRREINKGFKNSNHFIGDFFEKGDQAVKIEINGQKVKISRYDEFKTQRSEIRSFSTVDQAQSFGTKQQQWYVRQGYLRMNHKFKFTFVDQIEEEKKQTKTKPRSEAHNKNVLSITAMTDDAISHRSRNTSSAKSDRSHNSDDDADNQYQDTKAKLGGSASDCIKVLLAETYKEGLEPAGWIMSQKLDGVRCFWTGKVMYSRNGNRFYFPKFFTKNWPNSQLDGELFIGRGKFSQTLSAIKKSVPIASEWQKVHYLVFDCPGLKKPFKQRIKAMNEVISSIDNPYIKCHAHRQCTGFADLFAELDKVNKIQGEGLMLRDPESFYQNRRSNSLLKVKTFHDDEAVVLGYNPGTGRCLGMVGALRVRNTHGIEFEVGSGLTDAQRRHPPKIGSKITYKYQQFNKDSGKPRFPTYLRKFDDSI